MKTTLLNQLMRHYTLIILIVKKMLQTVFSKTSLVLWNAIYIILGKALIHDKVRIIIVLKVDYHYVYQQDNEVAQVFHYNNSIHVMIGR